MKQRALSRALALLSFTLALASSLPAAARVERFAVIVGNNHGLAHEATLRFAEADAKRVYDVLRELGGFEPVNMVMLGGAQADEVRRTLITVNDRIRAALALPNTEVALFVYYSGHADAEALHLGSTRLAIAELAQLVRGSSASFRMLVLDACQSGAATRVKGGRIAQPFALPGDGGLSGEGLALLTASAAHEDAQESDELGGSFFTHALVSGMLGAADRDRDGSVVLEEAYRYAYETTLRQTSRTAYGTQHPTFSYDLHGRGDVVLTRPGLRTGARGTLTLPTGASYLVLRGGQEGSVVAEIGREDGVRTLSLLAGPYFVRGRTPGYLLEGTIDVPSGGAAQLDAQKLHRIEYAHLVRKGGAAAAVHGIELGGRARTLLPNTETTCFGAYAGYRLDLSQAALSARFGGCTSDFENRVLRAHVDEYDLTLRIGHVWDLLPRVSLELGAGAGLVTFVQRFDTKGKAPTRRSLAGNAELAADIGVELAAGFFATVQCAAQLYVLELESRAGKGEELRAAFASRVSAGVGKRF